MPSLLCVLIGVMQHTTPWFERASCECHPNNRPEYRVLLGLLGNDVRQNPCSGYQPHPASRHDWMEV